MFGVFDRYLIRQLLVSTLVVAGSLSMVVLLTQSLRVIELVLESNASASAFMSMMALSLPRFFEAVLPVSVLISTIFVFHRLGTDSEMLVMRASGASPIRMARPVFSAGLMLVLGLLVLSLWISPLGVSRMQILRKEIRTQYTHLLFREGVFNSVGTDLTAYVRNRMPDGRLIGLMVHDTRGPTDVTVVARSGNIVSEGEGQKIVVYEGSRQESDATTGKFSRLDFRQYTLDIPAAAEDKDSRWREPDERTLGELTDPESLAKETPEDRMQFRAELHRRLTTPILMLAFAMMGAVFLMQGQYKRSGQMPLVGAAVISALVLQGLYLAAFNIAKKNLVGYAMMYGISLAPVLIAIFFLTPTGEMLLLDIARAWHKLRQKSYKNGGGQ